MVAIAMVLLTMGVTVGVAEHTRGQADERRQAQVELRQAQAATQQLRAIAAESDGAGEIDSVRAAEAFQAGAVMIAAIGRLEKLGVTGAIPDRLERAVSGLAGPGRDALTAARDGNSAAARRYFVTTLDPVLKAIIVDTEKQIAIEDKRARSAASLARWVLIGGVLFGLLALALLVRRFEAVARQGRAEAMLRRQAFTDALTGLPNRAALELALAQRLEQPATLASEAGGVSIGAAVDLEREPVAMALLDLDDLKTINDSLGHGRGDDLVRTIGARIAATLGPNDLVTRFGGDEFGVIMADPSPERAVKEMERVLRAIHRPILLGDRDVRLTASAGIAVGHDVETIVRDADIAMYAAKAAGKDRVAVFSKSMREDALANLELTADLRRAL
ncbi:MAG: GGDEF domain-containing protein, partial [Solirubrobacteraceae bacterium]|nr:GGDEF domain-containing protein [Solirubrobacteraceae bacterium]